MGLPLFEIPDAAVGIMYEIGEARKAHPGAYTRLMLSTILVVFTGLSFMIQSFSYCSGFT